MVLKEIKKDKIKKRLLEDALATVFLLTEGRLAVGELAVQDFWDDHFEEMYPVPDGDLLDDHIRRNAKHFTCEHGHPIEVEE